MESSGAQKLLVMTTGTVPKEENMIKKIIAFSFIAWAIAAISSPSPSRADVLIPGLKSTEVLTEAVVTGKIRDFFSPDCRGGAFYVQQLMVLFITDVETGSERVDVKWISTDTLYDNGPNDATSVEACENGDIIYGLGLCGC